MKNMKEEIKILLSRAYILAREDNYQHFDIIARMKERVNEIDRDGIRGREKMGIQEIRIRKLGYGYQYEHVQDNEVVVATKKITGLEAIRSVVGAIERWEKTKTKKIKDKNVCSVCGNNLVIGGDGIPYCERCVMEYGEWGEKLEEIQKLAKILEGGGTNKK